MTHQQMHQFHDELRAKYEAARTEADRLAGGDTFLEGVARGKAAAYAAAMATFWNIANEKASHAGK